MVKSRKTAFIGNLPYSTTKEDLEKLFISLGPIQIRLITDKATGKPKGYAFADCESDEQFSKLLKLHHCKFQDRRLNIELTAGGGGNSAARKSKIQGRNQKLQKYRQTLHCKSQSFKQRK